MSNARGVTVGYWICTVIAAGIMFGGGIVFLTRGQEFMSTLAHLGYPVYLANILGVWELLAGIVIAAPGLPRLKEWAYAGACFDLTGAAASHYFAGTGAVTVLVPLVVTGFVVASWALRPATRKLSSPAA